MKTPAGLRAIVLLAFVGVVAVARISERPVGALVIDDADAARRELVWRGPARSWRTALAGAMR